MPIHPSQHLPARQPAARGPHSLTRCGGVVGLLLALSPVWAPAAHAADRTPRRLTPPDTAAVDQQSAQLRQAGRDARALAMQKLKGLLAGDTELPSEQRAELILRLSEMYFDEGRDSYLDERPACDALKDDALNAGRNPDTVDCTAILAPSRAWQQKSIALYQQILSGYPQFTRADEATFYLGSAYNETSQFDLAAQQFTRLVKQYPDSAYATDAYVLIGEFYFNEKSEPDKALIAYKKASADATSDKHAFALYKLAWCYYNVQDGQAAIRTMEGVVAEAQSATASTGSAQLSDEALGDLVLFFADFGTIEEATDYLKRNGKQALVPQLLQRLATTCSEQGRFDDAITMYRRLITESPDAPEAAGFEGEIVALLRKEGRKEDTLAEIDRLRTAYGKQSAWARANAANPDAVAGVGGIVEKALHGVAVDYQQEARRLGTGSAAVKVYGLAEQAYRAYLQEFPSGPYAYEMRYNFSELLYKVRKFDEAYAQEMAVVAIDPNGQHSEFCANSSIFSASEMMKVEGAAPTAPGSQGEQPLSPWEARKLAALDQYAQLYPTDKTRGVIYQAGYLLNTRNHFREASDRFRTVIQMDPGSRDAEQAANLMLDNFALVGDLQSLKATAQFYSEQPGLGDAQFKKEVHAQYENATIALIAADLQRTGDKGKAAADYVAFDKAFPTSPKCDVALNNAAVYLHDLGRTADAIPVRLELINRFPKSRYYEDQIAALGYDYESEGQFALAADWYEELFAVDSAHPSAVAAIFSAAIFRNALGSWETAISDYQALITAYPNRRDIHALQLGVAETYEDHGKPAEAAAIYLAFFTKPATATRTPSPAAPLASVDEVMQARLHYGLLLGTLGRGAEAPKHWKDSLAWFANATTPALAGDPRVPGDEGAIEDAAHIRYLLAESDFSRFTAMRINGTDAKVSPHAEDTIYNDQLLAKARALAALESSYAAIVQTGAGEWGLASLVRLGQAYEDMAETFNTSRCPGYLDGDQCQIYKDTLAGKAFAQQEKAVAAYTNALKRAYELNAFDERTAFATRQLAVLRPLDYPGLFETVPRTTFMASALASADFEVEP